MLAWIVTGGEGAVAARPVTSGRGALPYVLVADTLEALRAQIPAGLARAAPSIGPEGMLEIWYVPG